MRAEDIITQLANLLPQHTDKLTTNVSVTSLTLSGTTVTAQCAAAHGMVVNQQVNIVGAKSPIVINSLVRSGTVGTLITDTPHDFIKHTTLPQTVELSGATEVEFNGTFVLLSVPNRNTVTFKMVDSGATAATGSPVLLNGWSYLQGFNGLQQITAVPAADQFQYEITTTPPTNTAAGTIVAKTAPRISGAVTEQRVIEAYTEQGPDEWWAFVVLGDVTASKSRQIDSDATANIQRGNEYRQQIIQPFNVLVLAPSSNTIAARQTRDECEAFFQPLCKSLLFSKLDSGLNVGAQNPISFVSHGVFAYDSAFYAHLYSFEAVADITFDDTVGYSEDVAFRDIDFTMFPDPGNQIDPLTILPIPLDDQSTTAAESFRITEDGQLRLSEDGLTRIVE